MYDLHTVQYVQACSTYSHSSLCKRIYSGVEEFDFAFEMWPFYEKIVPCANKLVTSRHAFPTVHSLVRAKIQSQSVDDLGILLHLKRPVARSARITDRGRHLRYAKAVTVSSKPAQDKNGTAKSGWTDRAGSGKHKNRLVTRLFLHRCPVRCNSGENAI